MKLWIDDIRNAPDESWTVARTVTSAIRAISQFEFEEISLDHDISHQVTVGALGRPYPCEETFMAVAYFIREKYFTDKPMPGTEGLHLASPRIGPLVTIHSSNLVAGEEMVKILKEYGIRVIHAPVHTAANRLEMEI